MKRIKQFLLPFISLVSAALIFTGCRSHHEADSTKRTSEMIVEHISKELALTDAQKATLNSIKSEILAKREEFKGLRTGLVEEMLEQVKKEKVDEASLNQSFEKREASFKELRAFLISKFAQFHATLTPEQKAKLAERIGSYAKRR